MGGLGHRVVRLHLLIGGILASFIGIHQSHYLHVIILQSVEISRQHQAAVQLCVVMTLIGAGVLLFAQHLPAFGTRIIFIFQLLKCLSSLRRTLFLKIKRLRMRDRGAAHNDRQCESYADH